MNDNADVELEESTDTLTDDLAAAWDASESTDGTEYAGSEVLEPPRQSDSSTDSQFGGPAADANQSDADASGVQPVEGQGPVGGQGGEANEVAPVGLSLESREAWKDVPDAVKADIVKREADYERGIVQYAGQAKRADAMDRSLEPYQQLFNMNGGAGETLQGLLKSGSTLQMGTPIQKAQTVAGIIKQFGIDIKTLDSMLVGEAPPPEQQAQNQVQQMINQQVAPMQQQLQGYQQREYEQHQQAQGQVAHEVSNFGAQNEFYNDVRGDMADLLDMAANRGREMSMDEAYGLACANHPQINQIMGGRHSQQSVDKKRRAASSISGTRSGGGSGQASGSIAAALNDAWDATGRM
jgi:hypothetical protein